MPRQYNRKPKAASAADAAFASGLLALIRPMLEQIVEDKINRMVANAFGEWLKKNAPTAAPQEPAPNGAKREG